MEFCKLKITNLKQGVKNPNRVNVFVEGKYEFSLDIAQVVDFKLKVGKLILPEELEEYKKASEFGKLYQRTLEWALVRPRSVRETRDYLQRKLRTKFSQEEVFELSKQIIERLTSRGYLSDQKFAEWYVENRFVKKGVSLKRLKMELLKKGVDKNIIDEVLDASERDDESEILKIIAKKRAKYTDEKLIQYLCRQGFPYEMANEQVRSFGKD